MSDRLDELRRQRALQREHLDWIEREIAALEGAAQSSQDAEPAPIPSVAQIDDGAAAILREYMQPAESIERRTKFGCVLYFALALALMALAATAVYFHARAGRGH